MPTANNAQELVNDIRDYCSAHADPAQVQKWARYFKEGFDAWGLLDPKNPLWNSKQTEWLEKYQGIGLQGLLKAGELLFTSGKYEEGALAIRFVSKHRDEIDGRAFAGLSRWFKAGIGNWAHTDSLCGEVIAPLLQSGRLGLAALAPWRGSSLKYQRRAVPVAMLGLLKRDEDVEPLLDFLRPLMADGERVVQQGLGWFLREAWKKRPEPVEAFLLEYRDSAPRLIFQYATEKMTAAARARFRRVKAR
ncbi:MAG: DNA alkylation repair protein [Rhodospirillales bacterium]